MKGEAAEFVFCGEESRARVLAPCALSPGRHSRSGPSSTCLNKATRRTCHRPSAHAATTPTTVTTPSPRRAHLFKPAAPPRAGAPSSSAAITAVAPSPPSTRSWSHPTTQAPPLGPPRSSYRSTLPCPTPIPTGIWAVVSTPPLLRRRSPATPPAEGPKRRAREGGSEWEPIKNLLQKLDLRPKVTSKDLYTNLPRSRSHNGPTDPRNKLEQA
jgi:hypothetical protein